LFFLACVAIGLPPWIVILYPTEQAISLLTSPGTWIVSVFIWLLLSFSFLIADST